MGHGRGHGMAAFRTRWADNMAVSSGPQGSEAEKILRETLWVNHGCPMAALDGDDGELQCSACGRDFKREPLLPLLNFLIGLGRLHVGKLECLHRTALEPRTA